MKLADRALALFALPITRQLARLNDNLEAMMAHFAIPTPEQLREARKTPAQVIGYDEEEAAVEEFVRRNRTSHDDEPSDIDGEPV